MSSAATTTLGLGVAAWYSAYNLTNYHLLPQPANPYTTMLSGAIAGTILAAVTSLPPKQEGSHIINPAGSGQKRAIFPEFRSEYVGTLPAIKRYQVLLRGAIGHAVFFTVFEGLRNSTQPRSLTSDKGKDTTAKPNLGTTDGAIHLLNNASLRFFSGAVASLGFRAAIAMMQGDAERISVSSFAGYTRILARSGLAAGGVMAVAGVLEDVWGQVAPK